jgi:HSP20 family molecular chaperone IbpA
MDWVASILIICQINNKFKKQKQTTMIYGTNDFNDMFEKLFSGNPNTYYKTSVITKGKEDENNYEVNQTKDGAYLLFEAPGFNKENLKVEIEDGVMTIQGKRKYKMNGEEISKSINKQFKLGTDYNAELIEATIEDGLLTVFIPGFKKQEKKKISLL